MPTSKRPAPRKPSTNGHSANGNGKAPKPAFRQPGVRQNRGNPHPPPPPKEFQFKPGVSGNPSGKPKLLGEAYKKWLADLDPDLNLTNAEKSAQVMGAMALEGGENAIKASREIRTATQGDMLALKFGNMTDEELLTHVRQQRQLVDDLLSGGQGQIVDGIYQTLGVVGAAEAGQSPAAPASAGEADDDDDDDQP